MSKEHKHRWEFVNKEFLPVAGGTATIEVALVICHSCGTVKRVQIDD